MELPEMYNFNLCSTVSDGGYNLQIQRTVQETITNCSICMQAFKIWKGHGTVSKSEVQPQVDDS